MNLNLAQKLALKRLLKALIFATGSTFVTTLALNINIINSLVPEKYALLIIPVLTSLLMGAEKYFKEKNKTI